MRESVIQVFRVLALVVIFLFVVAMIMAVVRPETGVLEKVVLGAGIAGLIVLATTVRRVASTRTPSKRAP